MKRPNYAKGDSTALPGERAGRVDPAKAKRRAQEPSTRGPRSGRTADLLGAIDEAIGRDPEEDSGLNEEE